MEDAASSALRYSNLDRRCPCYDSCCLVVGWLCRHHCGPLSGHAPLLAAAGRLGFGGCEQKRSPPLARGEIPVKARSPANIRDGGKPPAQPSAQRGTSSFESGML
eukprot:1188783-Prorocentrum_minimum.AAC.2